jgi:hypothetical protein
MQDSDISASEEKDYLWKDEQEHILKKWADKSICYKMMHERAYRKHWCLNAWFNIPIIIISTITGTGNFASNNFGSYAQFLIFIIGALNLFGAMLATIASYTGVAQKLESHRFAYIHWDKFSRKIQIELAKIRVDRIKAKTFIKQSGDEYDRMIEMSPILPNDIIRWFKHLIDTGKSEEAINESSLCCYEWFCFPCGCNYCFDCSFSFLNCNKKNEEEKVDGLKDLWRDVELPEIIGYFKPTEIAAEQQQKEISKVTIVTNKEENIYSIYK